MSGDTKLQVRQLVWEVQNTLSTSKNPSEVSQGLLRLSVLLPHDKTSKNQDFPDSELPEARKEFSLHHYVSFLEFLISKLSVDWLGRLGEERGRELLDRFFLDGVHQDAFIVLTSAVQNTSPSYKQDKCVSLLEQFLTQNKMTSMFWEQCNTIATGHMIQTNQSDSRRQPRVHNALWEELVTILATLPDRMANKLQQRNRPAFSPEQYFQSLALSMWETLEKVYSAIKASQDCSMAFLQLLLGKLCLQGHAGLVLGVLLPKLTRQTRQDFVWQRVSCLLLTGVQDRCVESLVVQLLTQVSCAQTGVMVSTQVCRTGVWRAWWCTWSHRCHGEYTGVQDRCVESLVVHLVTQVSWYGTLSRLLGDGVLRSQKLKYILTHKCLLIRHYEQDRVVQNIMGYLADSPTRRHLLIETLVKVLEVWSDSSAIKHTSYDQHAYLSKAILAGLSHLNSKEKQEHKQDFIRRLLEGVQHHIDSPVIKIRRLGMIVAESVTKMVDPDGQKLKFEYEEDEETSRLLSLLMPPSDPGDELEGDMETEEVLMSKTSLPQKEGTTRTSGQEGKVTSSQSKEGSDSELDSDDDLEPYDMPEDTKMSKVKSPVYIRDCLDGLIANEDADRVEACLSVCEQLVRRQPDNLEEVCVELVKILLHLQNSFAIPEFTRLRRSAMVATTVFCPLQVSQYLTSEFYAPNYTIIQRLDMLEVLVGAAQELSQPMEQKKATRPEPLVQLLPTPDDQSREPQHWREVVQKRIEKKTRRFAKGASKPDPTPVPNKFHTVAGHFFFPLLKNYDSRQNTLDMLGEDTLVLGRLVYSLGAILYAAANTMVARQMSKTLLEFVWVLRFHTEPYVRQSLLFAVSMVILSVPAHVLTSDLQEEIFEGQQWLQDVLEKDTDAECQKLAVQTLMLLQNTLQQELGGGNTQQ
ncbi:telomere length regulation protein TEL2 homolog [Branchiostoma floridae]|uniref:Telomere length regulation protein TEL2 homolog n=1 Tax=Branchiostoma floridae TaxID=7739 RepID=A0A9J7M795_BRAFL|nr:telomere length regulation protein TEL2 homolog [Branchiostoma floridae]